MRLGSSQVPLSQEPEIPERLPAKKRLGRPPKPKIPFSPDVSTRISLKKRKTTQMKGSPKRRKIASSNPRRQVANTPRSSQDPNISIVPAINKRSKGSVDFQNPPTTLP